MIGSLEECILDALSDGYQLNFGLVSFYPRLSGALPSRDSDPAAEGLYVRGAVKARRALRDGLKEKIDAVNSSYCTLGAIKREKVRRFCGLSQISQSLNLTATSRL
jgi:hypothetical protein